MRKPRRPNQRRASVAKPKPKAGESFRDRIVEVRKVRARELMDNDKNWRLHPEAQRGALRSMLTDVGKVNALLARKTPKGIELLDGHLRKDMDPEEEWTVLITDLNDEEAAKVLATHDSISGMALVDDTKLAALLGEIDIDDSADLRKLMADLTDKLADEEGTEDDEDRHEVAGMALQPHEHYDYLVILASTTQDAARLFELLDLKPEKRRGRLGTARAIRAEKLLALLEPKKK